MQAEQYSKRLEKYDDQETMGIIMGNALSDKEVKPEQYEQLCLLAKSKGFKFANIEVVPV